MSRTRTSSDIKWLANELAATAGEMERVDAELVRLQGRRQRLQASYAAMSQVASLLEYPQLPDVVPAVKPHWGYGKRGVLRAWLKDLLRAVAPAGVNTTTILAMAEHAFGLEFSTPEARSQYRCNSLVRQLGALKEQGTVERLPRFSDSRERHGVWRWKAERPSLGELAEQATRHEPVRMEIKS